ncbi:putative cytochrome P450 [Helianthus anomalus]
MAFLLNLIFVSTLLIFIYFLTVLYVSLNKNNIIPTNWPIFGMLPKTLMNSHRIYDYITEILACSGGTFQFKSSVLQKTSRFCTANPLDVHHILSKNFSNYPRGNAFREIFDILGDGFSNTDGDIWQFHHNTIMSLFKSPSFHTLLEETIWNKVEKGLMPVLEYVSKQEVEIDLQDIFQRFAFDTICLLLFDSDPKSMSRDFPCIPCEKALSEIEEAILHRYILPPRFWKIQNVLGMGHEKKLSNAWETVDEFIYKCLAEKRKEFSKLNSGTEEEEFRLSTAFLRSYKGQSGSSGDQNKFLRDTLLNLLVAGRDTNSSTLSWLFYLLSKNPMVVNKIFEELQTQLKGKDLHAIELNKLVYLHGALCESLRLFPPVPFQIKTPSEPDVLPSGQRVDHNTSIILSFYSMGRMKSIWGEDCMEFKPERWISVGGGINHQPSYKFPAFNAGPRTCLGKHMSFTQMKIVAATIIYHYHVDIVEGQHVFPSDSIILKMKNGLRARLTKRSEVKA